MKIAAILFMTAISCTLAGADEGHDHEAAAEPAPHGGMLRDAPPYKAELVLEGEQAKIYIYDPPANSIDQKKNNELKIAKLAVESIEGHLRFPKDKKEKPVKFQRNAEWFEATIPGINKVHRFDMHLYLYEKPNKGGKKVVLDFGIDNIH